MCECISFMLVMYVYFVQSMYMRSENEVPFYVFCFWMSKEALAYILQGIVMYCIGTIGTGPIWLGVKSSQRDSQWGPRERDPQAVYSEALSYNQCISSSAMHRFLFVLKNSILLLSMCYICRHMLTRPITKYGGMTVLAYLLLLLFFPSPFSQSDPHLAHNTNLSQPQLAQVINQGTLRKSAANGGRRMLKGPSGLPPHSCVVLCWEGVGKEYVQRKENKKCFFGEQIYETKA